MGIKQTACVQQPRFLLSPLLRLPERTALPMRVALVAMLLLYCCCLVQLTSGLRILNLDYNRDLKPGNLLVTKSCQLRITDFGLARERPLGRGADPDEEVC
jgi:hypothetical protein